MRYNIQPITGFGRTATTIDINVIDYQFGEILKIYYSVNDSNIIYEGNLIYDKDIIDKWGSDDNYIINLVLNQLNLTRL
jgi:hypothetical protein